MCRCWGLKGEGLGGACQVTRRVTHHATRKVGGRRCGFARLLHHDSAWSADAMLIRRIVDGRLLRVIMGWLTVPVMERVGRCVIPTATARTTRRGTPQSSVISPMLANLYLPRFLLAWRNHGHQDQLNAHVVNCVHHLEMSPSLPFINVTVVRVGG